MAENLIVLGAIDSPLFEFGDERIDSGSIRFSTAVDVVGSELSIDVYNATVRFPVDAAELFSPSDYDGILTSDGKMFATSRVYGDLRLVPYATVMRYYRDGNLFGKYYMRSVQRISSDAYKLTAMSAIGLIDTQMHYGGRYDGDRFEDVLDDILDLEFNYRTTQELASVPVFGWLPIASRRENLHALMMAYGVTLTKDADGDIIFAPLVNSSSPEEIPSGKIYYGGDVDYNAPATAVEVTEHSYFDTQTDETVTLYDNTRDAEAAVHLFVAFRDAPCHSLAYTGTLVIEDSGVNYAIVSGVGTLTGKKYTHTTRLVRREVANPQTSEKVVSLKSDIGLINPANSDSVAERLLAYYSSAKTIKAAIIYEGQQAGRQIAFTDPYGDPANGYIESMDVVVSGVIKAQSRIVTDYTPPAQSGGYANAVVLTGSDNWEVPDGIDKCKVTLIGGGQGGRSGSAGDAGKAGISGKLPNGTGVGGAGGAGGTQGKSITVTLTGLVAGTLIPYSCGVGGASDADGTDTVFGEYSSADGVVVTAGITNLFNGDIYARAGEDGVDGGVGASQGYRPFVEYNGRYWIAGEQGYGATGYLNHATGGTGGGAAVGSDGGRGNDAVLVSGYPYAGYGGAGATPIAGTDATAYGSGGNGGHGGGGGGQGGTGGMDYGGGGGIGGQGSAGGRGGNGCVIVYY